MIRIHTFQLWSVVFLAVLVSFSNISCSLPGNHLSSHLVNHSHALDSNGQQQVNDCDYSHVDPPHDLDDSDDCCHIGGHYISFPMNSYQLC